MRLIRKLLRKHMSFVQLAGFFLANFIGIIIILSGLQIYQDIKPLLVGDKELFSKDYVVISKPVTLLGDSTFDEEEVAEVADVPQLVELNSADSAALVAVRGIGARSASDIIQGLHDICRPYPRLKPEPCPVTLWQRIL